MCALRQRVITTLAFTLTALGTLPLAYHALAQPTPAQDKAATAKMADGDEKTIHALVTQLGDDDFDKRQAAEKRLAAIGPAALKLLGKAAKENADAEVRARAGRAVLQIEHQLFRAMLQDMRWGLLVDPDLDCRFRVDNDQLHIKIPPRPHVLSAEIGATNAPRVLRDIEGDFRAEVTVLGAIPGDARSLLNGRWPFYGAGLLVWQDERNYIRLERARMYYIPAGMWRCYVGWELRQDGQVERGGKWQDGVLQEDKPAFFRLDRKANVFTASYSQDGKDWKELPPVEAMLGAKLGVGVAAVQNTPAGYEAILKGLKITPARKRE